MNEYFYFLPSLSLQLQTLLPLSILSWTTFRGLELIDDAMTSNGSSPSSSQQNVSLSSVPSFCVIDHPCFESYSTHLIFFLLHPTLFLLLFSPSHVFASCSFLLFFFLIFLLWTCTKVHSSECLTSLFHSLRINKHILSLHFPCLPLLVSCSKSEVMGIS